MTDDVNSIREVEQAETMKDLVERAKRGDGRVACYLGDRYRMGDSVPHQPEESFRWYLHGALSGDESSMNNLAVNYQNGFGCQADPERAAFWYERAAELGLAAAQVNLARCYMGGVGVAANRSLGLLWLRRAAALGYQVAVDLLEKLREPIEEDATELPPTRKLH